MILVTGATGKTGSEAALRLVARGERVRALVRDPAKAQRLRAAGVEIATGDAGDEQAVRAALAGVTKAVLILPNGQRQLEYETRFTDLARGAGVRHLLKVSSMEAVEGATNPVHRTHLESEAHIRRSGLAWTIIRPNFYLQNFLGSAPSIRAQGKFFMPMGEGRAAMTDVRDIAEVIAHVLTSDGHENRSYDVTGPEILSFGQVAERFTEVLGRPVQYVAMDPQAYRERLSQVLKNDWHVNAVSDIFAEIREGYVAPVTDTFRQLTGREPTDTRRFIRDYAAAFGG
jgi:uncharacterized protein YbjT (DUF2867 family)